MSSETTITPDGISGAEYRLTMGQFATGVTIISTVDAESRPHGMTANSFASLSLLPPLVQWSLRNEAFLWPVFHEADHFAVNVLSSGQEYLSRTFSRPVDRFVGVETDQGINGVPLLNNSLAWIECQKVQEIEIGDHTIFVGSVLRTRVFNRTPLLFWRGSYLSVDEWEAVARTVRLQSLPTGAIMADHMCLQ